MLRSPSILRQSSAVLQRKILTKGIPRRQLTGSSSNQPPPTALITKSTESHTNKNSQLRRALTSTTDTRPQHAAAAQVTEEKGPVPAPKQKTGKNFVPMDGNQCAAHVAYALSDISFIYPISPATSMGEYMDEWAEKGRKNIFGQSVSVNMMQSEAGAAGALHGAGAAGALTSTFTASQGLLLMIPNMYLLAGELVPTVFHVAARTVSKHALSIFNDHSDVMSCRQTGFAMLCSSSVQEVMDLGLVAHVASANARLPFMHFFDGYRTSAEIQKVEPISYEDMKSIFPYEKVKKHLHDFALNPNHPIIRGTGQRPDIFFQGAVAGHKYYQQCPQMVEEAMRQVETITGRKYNLFDYYGSPTAERVVILMGSASKTMEEVVDYLNARGENVGALAVRLFRPWSAEHFYAKLPKSAKRIAVLDRTREEGASGMPLFLDVNVTLAEKGDLRMITGGQYGLASKEFSPGMAKAVFDNLKAEKPMMKYVIGIEDDVTHTSLPYKQLEDDVGGKDTRKVLLYGLGGDGMVGASKSMIKVLSSNTNKKVQGHFVYDSKKTEGLTVSHLRIGDTPIKAAYGIHQDADFIECANKQYVYKYDMLSPLKKGGVFVLNSPWTTLEVLEQKLPPHVKRQLAQKDAQLYNIDAVTVADQVGLGKRRVNSIMSAAFYNLSGVLPSEKALQLLKDTVAKQYAHKGPKVVEMNQKAVDATVANLMKIEYPKDAWLKADYSEAQKASQKQVPDFVRNIMNPVLSMQGDTLPVSAFEPGGYQPIGTTQYEKRGLAPEIPVWKPDNCTQCNYCAIVCPHAVVRPFLLDRQESKGVPSGYEYRKAKGGSEVGGMNYTIQISPMDCTGCAVCVESCPDDALYMAPFEDVAEKFVPHWDYSIALKEKGTIGDKFSVKGSQFEKPLMEFSCACSGCGETPYVKLVTQLFGDRMVVANASGCSSVWGGTSTTIPYAKNDKGRGPAWGRSLFEDNAEYGLGMYLGTKQRREQLAKDVQVALTENKLPDTLKTSFEKWLEYRYDHTKVEDICQKINDELQASSAVKENQLLRSILDRSDLLRPTSHWLIGGDGWAYDIGLGGVDHVLSLGENVNILVLDTEMYSNTGGEMSKSTPMAASVKYATGGKEKKKKDLGMHAMLYENVYVASVALGANMQQCVQAFKEAEEYPGPSLILAYSPCIDWGIEMRHMMEGQKQAVDAGYWTLYRYDPRRTAQGMNPFQLDSKKVRTDMAEFLRGQNRFERLFRDSKEHANQLQGGLRTMSMNRHTRMQELAMDDMEKLEYLMKKLNVTAEKGLDTEKSVVLYASETGNAMALAGVFSQEFKRRGINAKAMAMDDLDFEELPKYKNVYCVVATAGQGEFPANCQQFYKQLSEAQPELLKETKFAVFGLGDTGYVYYNEAAKKIDKGLEKAGAKRIMELGLGDDKDEERYETKWAEWTPNLWQELKTPPPPQELLPPTYKLRLDSTGAIKGVKDPIMFAGSKLLPMTKNVSLTPPEYDRIIRHYEFDIRGSGYQYGVGDSLGIHPRNDEGDVEKFLNDYGLDSRAVALLEDTLARKDALPPVVDVKKLFTEVLDIFGRPTRRFYETLSIAAKDETEKKNLEHLMTKEGAKQFKEMVKETVTYADLLLKYPSTKLSLEYLVDFIPKIKPRLYSIASSAEMFPEQIQLCIVKDDWTTPSGRYRQGLSTRYMEKNSLDPSKNVDRLVTRLSAAGITIPDSQKPPYLMVALGTGIAPMRAMVQDREVARKRGETVGEMALFFGARHKATDYTYGDEFEAFHSGGKGVLSVLSTAFSRDQAQKIYVQNRLAEYPEIVYDYLVKKNGYFYLCGPAGNVPPSVRKAICDAIVKVGQKTPEEADKIVTQMQIEGRYNIEAW